MVCAKDVSINRPINRLCIRIRLFYAHVQQMNGTKKMRLKLAQNALFVRLIIYRSFLSSSLLFYITARDIILTPEQERIKNVNDCVQFVKTKTNKLVYKWTFAGVCELQTCDASAREAGRHLPHKNSISLLLLFSNYSFISQWNSFSLCNCVWNVYSCELRMASNWNGWARECYRYIVRHMRLENSVSFFFFSHTNRALEMPSNKCERIFCLAWHLVV